MEGIHSYEQRSSSELGQELNAKQNRVIIVNRREPKVSWATSNQPPTSGSSNGVITYIKSLCSACLCCRSGPRLVSKIRSTSSESTPNGDRYDLGPYPTNEWLTSKYTLLNFIPKNLFEQFRRLANFYFLVTTLLQVFIPFSPVGPTTSLLPLVFVVSTSSIKQAYEDYLRHKLDKEVNNRLCHILRGQSLVKIRSKDIRVGDFVYVKNNEEVPCDMVLLAASGHGDRCYITTANLDGETSLKSRSCFQIKEQVGSIDQLDQSLIVVECERPNATLYEFNGYLRAPKSEASYHQLVDTVRTSTLRTFNERPRDDQSKAQAIIRRLQQSSQRSSGLFPHMSDYHDIPLDISNLLLRASRLRNTSYVYGLAVYTGSDTKLAQNSQVKPNKFSSTESKVNKFLIIAFVIVIFFTIIATLNHKRPNFWIFGANKEVQSTERPFEQILVIHFLIYNYLVPISLYVTLEFIKFFGTLSVIDDKLMKVAVWQSVAGNRVMKSKESADQKSRDLADSSKGVESLESSKSGSKRIKVIESPKCNSSDLNEELGQVEVLFSDKTGTLTENQMRFMACSVHGQLYRAVRDQLFLQPTELYQAPIPNVARQLTKITSNRHSFLNPSVASQKLRTTDLASSYKSSAGKKSRKFKPFDHRCMPPLNKMKLVSNIDQHERVAEFFICLCLCSTITLNETVALADCLPDKVDTDYDFQSASPDEESLISAAHIYGITMCKSNDRECYIVIKRSKPRQQQTANHVNDSNKNTAKFKAITEGKQSTNNYIVRHFERLMVFEFSSLRKRMSVVYRDCDNDCYLMVSKGSEEMLDCVDLRQLDPSGEQSVNAILAHFEAFAKSGLRTLLVASKVVASDEYERMDAAMKEARLSIQNRDHLLNLLYQRAESDLRLIGTTAVEDTLQAGVPETIANLREAGIKVWLLTGDKVETAISVAYLCKLLDREMILFHLTRQQDLQSCQKLITTYIQQMAAIRDAEQKGKSERSFSNSDPLSKSDGKSSKTTQSAGSAQASRSTSTSFSHLQSLSSSGLVSQQFALISDGRSLYYAMKYAKSELEKLCNGCACVLGCRLSPLQKAEVVSMIKQTAEKPITAAIGDGANDVSMIQEAHVGIGISGREGRQAVNCSDFAISRFHLLNRLFFIHGHLFYHRTANTILYFFYKNLLFITPQFLYSFYNISQNQSLYHPLSLIGYNLFFTSLPILLYGLFEVHIPESVLENYPKLYGLNKGNSRLKLSSFFTWLLIAALQASIGFYLLHINWGTHTPILSSGKVTGINGFSITLYFTLIATATLKLVFLSKYHSRPFNLSAMASCLLVPLIFYGYSLVDWSNFTNEDNSLHGQFLSYLASPMFWLAIFSTTTATLLPNIVCHVRSRINYFRRLNGVMNSPSSVGS